jgi:hypothetical protein
MLRLRNAWISPLRRASVEMIRGGVVQVRFGRSCQPTHDGGSERWMVSVGREWDAVLSTALRSGRDDSRGGLVPVRLAGGAGLPDEEEVVVAGGCDVDALLDCGAAEGGANIFFGIW